jgi:hypothetical protein
MKSKQLLPYIFGLIPLIVVLYVYKNEYSTIYEKYKYVFEKYANSHLGKFISILICLLFLMVDKWLGLLAVAVTILFYEHYSAEPFSNETIRHEFEKKHCKKGVLKYKTAEVNIEMVEHVFPELQYKNKKCNPCDSSCDYTILEEKLKMEERMVPKQSNDWVDKILNKF